MNENYPWVEPPSSPEITIEEKATEYIGGHIRYSVAGAPAKEHNPVLIVPGFTEGRFVLQDFAAVLSGQGDRQVIFPDQPILDKKPYKKMPVIDHHAMALLEVINTEDLGHRPVDIITHSFGSLIAFRMAELAKLRGFTSFDSKNGSHSVFLAPAGSNDKENLVYLGARWLKFIQREANPTPLFSGLTRELDPTGEKLKAGQKNAKANPAKTVKEVLAISQKENIYKYLGGVGLRPFVFGYARDVLYPHKVIKTALEANGEGLAGYGVPIDNGGVGAGSFKQFKQKTGLKGNEAKKAWSHHYRNAGHNDFLYHPERSVKAILQVIGQ